MELKIEKYKSSFWLRLGLAGTIGAATFALFLGAGVFFLLPTKKDLLARNDEEPGAAASASPSPSAAAKRPNGKTKPALPRDRQKIYAALLELTDANPGDVRFCENLARPSEDSPTANLFGGKSRDNLMSEVLRTYAVRVMQAPGSAELLREIVEFEEKQTEHPEVPDEGVGEKFRFYSHVARIGFELRRHQREYEMLSDRLAHVFALERLALANPGLKDHPKVLGFCRKLENLSTLTGRAQLEAERRELVELFTALQIDPKQKAEFLPKSWASVNGIFKTVLRKAKARVTR